MAQEIGTAYVTIQPSTRNFGKAIDGEIAGSVESGTKKGGNAFLAATGKWVGRAGLAGAAIVTAFTIKGGISRLMAIDEAEAKLRGLGFTAEGISTVMDNALAAVKGTAFGLGDAATAAASATAAGIKPGKELENYLRLIGDAATIGGTSFNEMGDIINKVTAKGTVGMDNLNQLTERGIPILAWLQEEYGVTADELAKMVSRGEVDSATFQKVIEENIGGAALSSGDTVRGAFANLGASLGRIGAGLFGGLFEKLSPALQGITEALGPVEERASRIGEAIGGWLSSDGAKYLGDIRDAAVDLFGAFKGSGGTGELQKFADTAAGVWESVKSTFQSGVTIVQNLWRLFGEDSISYLKSTWGAIQQVFSGAFTFIQGIFNIFAGILSGDWSRVWDGIKQVVSGAFDFLGGLVQALWGTIVYAFQNIGTVVGQLWSGLWSGIQSLASQAVGFVVGQVTAIPGRILGLLGSFKSAGTSLMQGFLDGLNKAGGFVADFAAGVWGAVKKLINSGIDKINSALEFTIDLPGPLGSVGVNPKNIPHLYTGGVVRGSMAGTLAVIGDRGHDEAVVPLEGPNAPDWIKGGVSGGVEINLNAPETMSPRELADHVAAAFRWELAGRGGVG